VNNVALAYMRARAYHIQIVQRMTALTNMLQNYISWMYNASKYVRKQFIHLSK